MTIKLGVVMDPISSIHYKKDSTLAMLWEAKARGWTLYYFEQKDLYLQDGIAYGDATLLEVFHDPQQWFAGKAQQTLPLADLDVILMRKDPPFNEEYIYTTHILEQAERAGVLVMNKPQSLRDFNEKLFISYFPQCAPASLMTRSIAKLWDFWKTHEDIVCKPLEGMGGTSVFRLQKHEVNATVIFETLTRKESAYVMAQQFIPAIQQGDKRILMINGEAFSHALARVPQGNDWRGNLAVGAKGIAQPLSERDHFICAQIGPVLLARGLYFVGLDVIGDYLTEINITSPTGIRELDLALKTNISALFIDVIEKKLAHPA
ncbi:MAG: glutathione synthase [Gammaproteobacteria bacterium]|nr:glutathione synthase [Gammaproteobacteria bacterium]